MVPRTCYPEVSEQLDRHVGDWLEIDSITVDP
jgi:hypothetical protein